MRNNDTIETISLALLVVGGLNWLLVGLFDLDLVASLFGDGTLLSRIIYVLVGAAAVYTLYKMANRRTAIAV